MDGCVCRDVCADDSLNRTEWSKKNWPRAEYPNEEVGN